MLFQGLHAFAMLIIICIIIAGIVYAALLLTGAHGFGKLAEIAAESEPAYARKIRTSETVTGTVTQIREIRPGIAGRIERHDYQIAVSYLRGSEQLTALFGIVTEQPLALKEGSRVKLRVFSCTLTEPNADAWQRTRLAAGCLPQDGVHYREYQGVPTDETATVIFEEDFGRLKLTEEAVYMATDHKTLPDTLKIFGAVLCVIAAGILIFVIRLISEIG